MPKLRENKWSRILTLAFSILAVVVVVYFLGSILVYVVIAWVLSMIGRPVIHFLLNKLKFNKLKSGSALAAFVVLILYGIFFWIIFTLFFPKFVEQASVLSNLNTNTVTEAMAEPLVHLDKWLVKINVFKPGQSVVHEMEGNVKSILGPAKIGRFFTSIISLLVSAIFGLFAVVFILFFFLKEDGLMLGFLHTITPSKYDKNLTNAVEKMTRLLSRYFLGISLQILTITTIVSVGLGILGVENAFLIGLFAAFINVIPYLGPMLGAFFGMFIVITSGIDADFYAETVPKLWRIAIVFGVVQMVDNFILQPTIFAKSVLAHPLEIFIVILIGGNLGGVIGMIVAIPLYSVLRVMAHVFLSEFEVVQRLTTRMDEIE